MKCLIAGHSQVKYFEQYVSLSNVKCLSYSGLSELLPDPVLKVKRQHDTSEVRRVIPKCQVSFEICIMKQCLFKYIDKLVIFLISAQHIDCGYTFEPPSWGDSNEYPQSLALNDTWNK